MDTTQVRPASRAVSTSNLSSNSPSVTSVTSVRCFPLRGSRPASPRVHQQTSPIPLCGLCDLCAMLSLFACPSRRQRPRCPPNVPSFIPETALVFRRSPARCSRHRCKPGAWFPADGSGRCPFVNSIFIPLRAGEDQNVFVTGMFMQMAPRHARGIELKRPSVLKCRPHRAGRCLPPFCKVPIPTHPGAQPSGKCHLIGKERPEGRW